MGRGTIAILILLFITACGFWTNQAQAGIILKATVVNPSRTKTQTAVLKAYLPKEVKPEDVIELKDLKIDYDVEKGLYYVYKKFELAPGESAIRSVEIRDVWVISKAEIDALTSQAKELVEKLKKTIYFETAVIIQEDIESKSSGILNKQEEAKDSLPQTHIAVYRENVKVVNLIKANLNKLDEMFFKVKLASSGVSRERVSVKATWWVILGVIIVLGLLSLIFFIIWQRQANLEQKDKKGSTPFS